MDPIDNESAAKGWFKSNSNGSLHLKLIKGSQYLDSVSNDEGEAPKIDHGVAAELRIQTLVASWISVIVLVVLGAISLGIGIKSSSSDSVAFGIDALLDCLSSVVVIWRFSGTASSIYASRKEHMACLVLGVLFIGSSLFLIIRSVYIIAAFLKESNVDDTVQIIAIISAIACAILSAAKIYLGYRLNCRSLYTDALNSLIGVVISAFSIVSNAFVDTTPDAWLIGPVSSILCSALLNAYGIWLLYDSIKHLGKDNYADLKA